MLIFTANIALLAFSATNLSQTTYAVCCLIVPATLALTFRYCQNINHKLASVVVLGSAIGIGSLLMAYGSYDKTFNEGAVGYLVGDGWNSVAASAVFGGIAGFIFGPISLLLYFVSSSMIGKPISSASENHAE